MNESQKEQLETVQKLMNEFENRCVFYASVMRSAADLVPADCEEAEYLLAGAEFVQDVYKGVNEITTSLPDPTPLNERIAVLEERLNNHINVKSPWNVKIEMAINDILAEAEMEPREFTNA